MKRCEQRIPILFCSFICWYIYIAEVWVFCGVYAVVHIVGVCAIFSPPIHWACYEQLRSKMTLLKIVSIDLESNKHVTISQCPILLLEVVVQDWIKP